MILPVKPRLRALFAVVLVPLFLAACADLGGPQASLAPLFGNDIAQHYSARQDGDFVVPAVDYRSIPPQYLRQRVDYPTDQPQGTVIVDPQNHYLYLVEGNGKALRYGVGVGKAGLAWSGTAHVGYKRQWPRWTPTSDMIGREPDRYSPWRQGMDGGPRNPLGARALYLWKDNKDTLYRLHGTTDPSSIGKSMSSGCIRMLNQDVIDLFQRVPTGTKVVVL
jgi:lipoprotein-anchoring transpeptidase ErfK/SrfK